MKVLILNGSPNKNGDTKYIINKVMERFPKDTEFVEFNAFEENIEPCNDCRYCWKNKGCCRNDRMEIISKDDYDVIVIASPLYMEFLTPPLFSIITRLNYIWSNEFFLKFKDLRKKKGMLILVGGGTGVPDHAISIAEIAFRFLNADFNIKTDYIHSLKTNFTKVEDDKELIEQIDRAVNGILNV